MNSGGGGRTSTNNRNGNNGRGNGGRNNGGRGNSGRNNGGRNNGGRSNNGQLTQPVQHVQPGQVVVPHGNQNPQHGLGMVPHGNQNPQHGQGMVPNGYYNPQHGQGMVPNGYHNPQHGQGMVPNGYHNPQHGQGMVPNRNQQRYQPPSLSSLSDKSGFFFSNCSVQINTKHPKENTKKVNKINKLCPHFSWGGGGNCHLGNSCKKIHPPNIPCRNGDNCSGIHQGPDGTFTNCVYKHSGLWLRGMVGGPN